MNDEIAIGILRSREKSTITRFKEV